MRADDFCRQSIKYHDWFTWQIDGGANGDGRGTYGRELVELTVGLCLELDFIEGEVSEDFLVIVEMSSGGHTSENTRADDEARGVEHS